MSAIFSVNGVTGTGAIVSAAQTKREREREKKQRGENAWVNNSLQQTNALLVVGRHVSPSGVYVTVRNT